MDAAAELALQTVSKRYRPHGAMLPMLVPSVAHIYRKGIEVDVVARWFDTARSYKDRCGPRTFRTVDNFVHGYGLIWNVSMRVQAYSNPLWMLLVIPFYWLSGEIYYTAIALSMTVSLLAVWILCARFARSGRSALLAAFVLVCSKAFTDYSTSGLENPLTHLLLAAFYVVFLDRGQDRRAVFYLALLAALATVNRLDAIVLFAPPLAYALWSRRGRDAVVDCCLGFTPLALWELFSLLYYGFPFPNTAYAKLATGLPLPDRLSRGVDYLYNSLSIDPLTLAVIAVESMLGLVPSRPCRAVAGGRGGLLSNLYNFYRRGLYERAVPHRAVLGRYTAAFPLCRSPAASALGVGFLRVGAGRLAGTVHPVLERGRICARAGTRA